MAAFEQRYGDREIEFRCKVSSQPGATMTFSMDDLRDNDQPSGFVRLTQEQALAMSHSLLSAALAMQQRDRYAAPFGVEVRGGNLKITF